jgi:hypothetical protein
VTPITPSEALPVRPGEHACCRFATAAEGERLAAAFVRNGLTRGNKVLYLCDAEPPHFARELLSWDARIAPAIARGQLELRCAQDTYLTDGSFRTERMLEILKEEQELARARGYALSFTGEMTWALDGATRSSDLLDYELRVTAMTDDDTLLFCQYDQSRFDAANTSTAEIMAAHEVDIGPELAGIGGTGGYVAAAAVGDLVRLTGALDFASAEMVTAVLDRHYDEMRLDLADIDFIDVAGLRSLRGAGGRALKIEHASDAVVKLLALLGWGTRLNIDVENV